MNLLETYIKEVISVEDVTLEWTNYKRANGDPDYVTIDPILEVVCKTDCYGDERISTHRWRQSEYEKYIEQGYFMG